MKSHLYTYIEHAIYLIKGPALLKHPVQMLVDPERVLVPVLPREREEEDEEDGVDGDVLQDGGHALLLQLAVADQGKFGGVDGSESVQLYSYDDNLGRESSQNARKIFLTVYGSI